ncbi:uncharacterized protein [Onthophagus taurus]|uniref:uncharacterized protein n=1 Tax=Onthophagus taurus TaxID=166361 RepID=UPI0039BE9626
MPKESFASELDVIFERQNELYSSISRAADNARKLAIPKRTSGQFVARLERLTDNWAEFSKNHRLLNQYRSSYSETVYFSDDLYNCCEESYIDSKAVIIDMLNDIKKPSDATVSTAPDVVESRSKQLPRISLPTFSGRYADWTQFRDLFVTMVKDNASLTKVEKFQYLKMSLEKEPSKLVKNLLIINDNFDVAWTLLVERYENLRILIDTQLTILLSIKALKTESSVELNMLISEVKESLGALECLGCPVDHWDHLLIHILVRKLDCESIKEWEKSITDRKVPSKFSEFSQFLIGRVLTLEAIEKLSDKRKNFSFSSESGNKSGTIKSHNASAKNWTCVLCGDEHYLSRCKAFLAKLPKQRSEFVADHKRCYNCLGRHLLDRCLVTTRCRTCAKRHHSLLHEFPPEKINKVISNENNKTNSNLPEPSTSHRVHSFHIHSSVLLATALIKVKSVRGDLFLVRALIHQGSEVSFISESLVQRLSLPRSAASVPINGVGSTRTCISNGLASIQLVSRRDGSISFEEKTFILPKLTSYVPKVQSKSIPPELKTLDLADPEFNSNRKIDLILGVKFYSRIIQNNIRKFNNGFMVAQKTLFGWILFGSVSDSCSISNSERYGFQCSVDRELLGTIQRFWKLEDDSVPIRKLSSDKEECENHFLQTYSRDLSGRFVLRLPFKRSPLALGASYNVAVKSFGRMEQRFAKSERLSVSYHNFMHEYLSLGDMQLVSSNIQALNYYLPHHGVVHESSTTTKLRVVFNGSAPTSSGLSLMSSTAGQPAFWSSTIRFSGTINRHVC